jgi:hypothetical protein
VAPTVRHELPRQICPTECLGIKYYISASEPILAAGKFATELVFLQCLGVVICSSVPHPSQ